MIRETNAIDYTFKTERQLCRRQNQSVSYTINFFFNLYDTLYEFSNKFLAIFLKNDNVL